MNLDSGHWLISRFFVMADTNTDESYQRHKQKKRIISKSDF